MVPTSDSQLTCWSKVSVVQLWRMSMLERLCAATLLWPFQIPSAHARCMLGQLDSCTLRGRVGARITLQDRRRAARSQESPNKRRKVRFERFVVRFGHLHLESAHSR